MKHPSSWTEKGKKRLFLALLLAAVGVLILIGWQVGGPILRLAADPEAFRQWIAQRQAGGLLLYGGMVFFQVLFAIIPGEPLEIAGGYAFGALWGTVACLAAATLGSVVGLCPGAAVRHPAGGGLLPQREAPPPSLSPVLPPADLPLLFDLHDPRHPQGSAVLLRRANGHQAPPLPAHLLPGAAALSGDLHGGGQRPGHGKLCPGRRGLCRHPPHQRGGAAVLPAGCAGATTGPTTSKRRKRGALRRKSESPSPPAGLLPAGIFLAKGPWCVV